MLRAHSLHTDLYCHKAIEEVYSSEEEEIAGGEFEDVNVDRNMGHEAEDQGIEATSQGTKMWWTKFLCILAINLIYLTSLSFCPYFILRQSFILDCNPLIPDPHLDLFLCHFNRMK